jgi:hypothetical protein
MGEQKISCQQSKVSKRRDDGGKTMAFVHWRRSSYPPVLREVSNSRVEQTTYSYSRIQLSDKNGQLSSEKLDMSS